MRFATIGFVPLITALCLSLPAQAADQQKPQHHGLKLPQSLASLLIHKDRTKFAVAEPLLPGALAGSAGQAATRLTAAPATATYLGSVRQGFYPLSEAKDEGFNFTGMTRQLPDLTRSAAATDTAGVMSWTAKFN